MIRQVSGSAETATLQCTGSTKHKEGQETESSWRSNCEIQSRDIRKLRTGRDEGGEEAGSGVYSRRQALSVNNSVNRSHSSLLLPLLLQSQNGDTLILGERR